MSKIAFLETSVLWGQHYETGLELMQLEMDAGNDIYQMACSVHLPVCEINHNHDFFKCMSCISKRKFGVENLDKKVKVLPIISITSEQKAIADSIQFYGNTLAELKAIKYEEFEAGMAAASSLISNYRDPRFDVIKDKERINNYLKASVAVYFTMLNYLNTYKFDKVYIFNGRYTYTRAALRACEKLGVTYVNHERGNSPQHYQLYENRLPHDLAWWQSQMHVIWDKADPIERVETGKLFYHNRSTGIPDIWYSFSQYMEKGLLPLNWNPEKWNIVIFNSSEDEMAAISEEIKMGIYESQLQAIQKITTDLKGREDIHIYLRIHPNLKGSTNYDFTELFNIKTDNFTIIPPEASTNSYDLIDHSSVVLNFGSTIGIEAAFRGKPAVLAESTYFDKLDVNHIPKNHEEVIEMITSKNLKPLNTENFLKFGYYMKTFGMPFKHFKAIGFESGTFKGVEIVSFKGVKWKTIRFILKTNWLKPFQILIYRFFNRNTFGTTPK